MSQPNQPKVAIIILNWNGINDTLQLLKNLEKIDYSNFSVLVVDNHSSDDSVGQIARYMEERRRAGQEPYHLALLPLSKNFGYAEGNNKGLKQASREKPDYYLLLNNDTIVDPACLRTLVEAAEQDPKLGALGPTISFATPEGQKQDKIWYAGGWLNFYAGGAHHNTDITKVDLTAKTAQPTEFISGCCLLLRQSAIASLDELFDPAFFAYNEDVDLCLRLQTAGWSLGYVPAARLWHKLAASSGGPKSSNFWYYNVRNNFLVVARYGKWHHWPVFLLYFLFYKPVLWSVVGAIVRPRRDKWYRLLAIAEGCLDALLGRYGQRG